MLPFLFDSLHLAGEWWWSTSLLSWFGAPLSSAPARKRWTFRLTSRSVSRSSLWQCNHRDWGDFFIDLYVVEGRAGFLSRLAVLIAFPVFGIYGLVTKTACFFRRNSKGRDFSKFNERVTQHIQRSPCQGIVVYPEGTRNIKPESLPLRRGMIRYAYAEWSPSKS